jgi:hypothetical protein
MCKAAKIMVAIADTCFVMVAPGAILLKYKVTNNAGRPIIKAEI